MFDPCLFIQQSNLIDPQYDEYGHLVPGQNPGDPMYDNQMNALNLIPEFINFHANLSKLPLLLHRELTRGISVFENRGESGSYRKCDVWIGGEKAPKPFLASKLIDEVLVPRLLWLKPQKCTYDKALSEAWWCHNVFECCHPFVDGNGRTGRLILNAVIEMLGHEKIIIYNADKMEYYAKIRSFKEEVFNRILQEKT